LLNKKVDLVTEYSLRKQWKEAILSQVKYVWGPSSAVFMLT
jgi:predicted nucleotidyltransferase